MSFSLNLACEVTALTTDSVFKFKKKMQKSQIPTGVSEPRVLVGTA